MIVKISKGSGFRAALDYDFGPGKSGKPHRAELIGGNMAGTDVKSLAAEFEAVSRDDVKKPVLRFALSAAHEDGKLSDERWNEVARDFLTDQGLDPDKHQWCAVRHTDREHDHIHITVNRVDLDRHLAREQIGDYRRAVQSCRAIETKYGLHQCGRGQEKQASAGLIAEIRGKVDKHLDSAKNWSDFKNRMKADGIEIKEFRNRDGVLTGLKFQADGHAPVKGSELGREYSARNLLSQLNDRQAQQAAPTATAAAATVISGAGKLARDLMKQQQQQDQQQKHKKQRNQEVEM